MYRTDSNLSSSARLNAATRAPAARPVRYRTRDFGTGYGTSSGYAAPRSYTPGSQPAPRFRFV